MSNDQVHRLFFDHAGTLWAPTDDGLDRFDPLTGTFKVYRADWKNRGAQSYISLAEDQEGELWLCTRNAGLQRFNPATERFTVFKANPSDSRSLRDNMVSGVQLDGSSSLWVSTFNGLQRLDRTMDTFVSYDERDGLAGNAISCMLKDSHGDLWMSTNRGISSFHPQTRTFKNYSMADGLPGDDLTGWEACFKSPDGEMFFGGFSGAVAFRPESFRESSSAPPISLTELRLSGSPVIVGGDSPLRTSISYTDRLKLTHEQSTFSLTFSALSYLSQADQVLIEGRRGVRGLRAEGSTANELSQELADYGEELAKDRAIAFKVTPVGCPESLHAVAREEIYRIAREALANAFRHSQASSIDVEVAYDRATFCLRVRDNGSGIDQETLDSGRKGHWGLSGMRERAQNISAQLSIWSNPGAGTEIDLKVPAKIAYAGKRKASRWRWTTPVSSD